MSPNASAPPAPARLDRVILAWDKDDLPSSPPAATALVPLTPMAYLAVRELGSIMVLETDQLLGAAESFMAKARPAIRSLEQAIRRISSPWLASFVGMELVNTALQVQIWSALLQAVCQRSASRPLTIIPPRAFEEPQRLRPGSWDVREMEAFWICARALVRRGLLRVEGRQPLWTGRHYPEPLRILNRTVVAWAGRAVCFLARFLLVGEPPPTGAVPTAPTRVLLAGVQLGDAAHQAPLAERLYARYRDRFAWLSFIHDKQGQGLVPEERALFDSAARREAYWIDADQIPTPRWRHERWQGLANAYGQWQLAGLFARHLHSCLSRSDWQDWLYVHPYTNLTLGYERWRRLLDLIRPRVIVGFSALQNMAFIRAWARDHRVPFVLFPHGIMPNFWTHFQVDADYLGVFGQPVAEQVDRSGVATARLIRVCGAMQFRAKSLAHASSTAGHGPNAPAPVLFLGSVALPFFPLSPRQRCTEMETLHQATRTLGRTLFIREHPRSGKNEYRPIYETLARRFPGTIALSTEQSLAKDLDRAAVVVTSGFDGAMFDSLSARKPVVAYLPEGHWHHSTSSLDQIDCVARQPQQLLQVLQQLLAGGAEARATLSRQAEFLNRYFDDLDADPWARAEELVGLALDAAENPEAPGTGTMSSAPQVCARPGTTP